MPRGPEPKEGSSGMPPSSLSGVTPTGIPVGVTIPAMGSLPWTIFADGDPIRAQRIHPEGDSGDIIDGWVKRVDNKLFINDGTLSLRGYVVYGYALSKHTNVRGRPTLPLSKGSVVRVRVDNMDGTAIRDGEGPKWRFCPDNNPSDWIRVDDKEMGVIAVLHDNKRVRTWN